MNAAIFVWLCCAVAVFHLSYAQILYPERFPIDEEKSNLAGRIPLYSPSRCKQNELLYPGDHADDWICDCAPASLYYPDSDACHKAFLRGPCEDEHMLFLAPNTTVPQCIKNACKVDGLVKINNVCYEIGRAAPCQNAHLSYVLGVNLKTLMLDCIKLSPFLNTRIGLTDNDDADANAPLYDLSKVDLCARGTQRSIEGTCTAAKGEN